MLSGARHRGCGTVAGALLGLLLSGALGAQAAESGLRLRLDEDGRIRLSLDQLSSSADVVSDSESVRRSKSWLLSAPTSPSQPVVCALGVGSILCGDASATPLGEAGFTLTWSREGWRLALDYRRLLLSAPPPGRLSTSASPAPVEGEQFSVSSELGRLGLSLAVEHWQSPLSLVDRGSGVIGLYGMASEQTGLRLDVRHAGLTGRLGARRSEDVGGGVLRTTSEAIDLSVLLKTPWRAELEMGALNLWHDRQTESHAQPSPPRLGRTPYVRYRQDF